LLDIEIADHLTRQGSSLPHTGPQPGPGITAKHARGVIKGWMNGKHEEYWQSMCGQRQAKAFLKISAKIAWELLNLSRNQL
jgi:hypothetical protein